MPRFGSQDVADVVSAGGYVLSADLLGIADSVGALVAQVVVALLNCPEAVKVTGDLEAQACVGAGEVGALDDGVSRVIHNIVADTQFAMVGDSTYHDCPVLLVFDRLVLEVHADKCVQVALNICSRRVCDWDTCNCHS